MEFTRKHVQFVTLIATMIDAALINKSRVNSLRKDNIERLASKNYGIQDKTEVKELVEYAIIRAARTVISHHQNIRGRYNALVELYNIQPNLTHRSSMSTIYQQYSTPVPIAYIAGVYAGLPELGCEGNYKGCKKGYEPSAGNGLFTIAADPDNMIVNEIDKARRSILDEQGFSSVSGMDASSPMSFMGMARLYHSVITNPPFDKLVSPVKVNGTSFDVLDHLMAALALELMTDDGKAAIIIGGHTQYDQLGRITAGKNRKFLAYLYKHYNVEDVINLDGKLYTRQGTSFNIRLILISGRKETPGGFPPLLQDIEPERRKLVSTFEELYQRVKNAAKWPELSDMKKLSLKARSAKAKLMLMSMDGLGAPYMPISESCHVLNVDVPDSMDFEIHSALDKLKKAVGDVTEFVTKKLHYPTSIELCKALAAEQIDAVALGIYNFEEKGQGIIIGDQTGIGKGRQAAAFIRYAVLDRKLKPVFLTEKPNLFSDMYRDLKAIGSADLKPFIVNTAEEKSKVKDEDGTVVYEAPARETQNQIIKNPDKGLAPFDYIMATYSQFNRNKRLDTGELDLDEKGRFLLTVSTDNLFILDESHNASGTSNTGMFLGLCVGRTLGTLFLSATFAKRPDNMPIYAMKTSLQDSNMSDGEYVAAFEKGGVALQEVVASLLVSEGQMIRRERTYEGVKVNYMSMDARSAEHRAIADKVTAIIREIIQFQKLHIDAFIEALDKIVATQMSTAKKTAGTNEAGVDNTSYFSKVFNVINQMLFAIKAPDVADHAIERLKEGKKVVIAFSSTMGAFLDELEMGDVIKADFSEVLMRGLKSTLRYTETDAEGNGVAKFIPVDKLSALGQRDYQVIVQKIHAAATGISISPIDVLVAKITQAGFKVAEVTGRSKELVFAPSGKQIEEAEAKKKPQKTEGKLVRADQIPKNAAMIMHPNQVNALVDLQTEEHWRTFEELEADAVFAKTRSMEKERKSYLKQKNSDLDFEDEVATPVLHYFNPSSDWYVYEWDVKDDLFFGYAILNGDLQNAEWGYIQRTELLQDMGMRSFELDFFFNKKPLSHQLSKFDGLGNVPIAKTNAGASTALIQPRKRENATDAFRKFQNNEVDVLLINQSGSTGASAHAIPTKKVSKDEVKPRVMIVLQAELDINREVQKRGRINRTGQIIKPEYDYLTSTIPAEQRLMMMLQKKLKSLDANTSSNQKQSKALLDVPDFLNKYGDRIVYEYLIDNPKINVILGDPLGLKEGAEEVESPKSDKLAGAAHKVSGRVAILPVKDQEEFYSSVIGQYEKYVNSLKQTGEYDLEMETQDLEAETLEHTIVMVNANPGKSVFADHSYLEKIEANNLRKPYKRFEVEAIVQQNIAEFGDASGYQKKMANDFDAFMDEKLKTTEAEIEAAYAIKIAEITEEKGYLKLDDEGSRLMYIQDRKKVYAEAKSERITQNQNTHYNQKIYLNNFFRFFYPGRSINYPTVTLESGAVFQPAVFLGFDIDVKKKNPYAPSAITASVAIAGSMKRVDIPLSGDFGSKLLLARSSSTDIMAGDYYNDWDNLIVKSSKNRGIRYVVTGNLLQVIAKNTFKGGALVSYSVKGGGVKKGYLLPEAWTPNFDMDSKDGSAKIEIPVPVSLAYDFIKSYASVRNPITTSDAMTFGRTWDGVFTLNVPVSRTAGGKFYQNLDLVALTSENNFNKSGSLMIAKIEEEDIKKVLTFLQDNFKLNVLMDRDEFERQIKVDKGALPKALPEPAKEKPLIIEEPEETLLDNPRVHIVRIPEHTAKSSDRMALLKLKAKAAKAKLMLMDMNNTSVKKKGLSEKELLDVFTEMIEQDPDTLSSIELFPNSVLPGLLWHGSNKKLDHFSLDYRGSNTGYANTDLGVFFLDRRHHASMFGSEIHDCRINVKKLIDLRQQAIFTKKEQAPVLLELISGKKYDESKALRFLNKLDMDEFIDAVSILFSDKARQFYLEHGYDAAISRFGDEPATASEVIEYILFEPNKAVICTPAGFAYHVQNSQDSVSIDKIYRHIDSFKQFKSKKS